MVMPQWGSFQKPNQESPEQPRIQEQESNTLKDEMKPEGEKPQWGSFQTPNTYQGEPDPLEEESLFGGIIRNLVSNTFRGAEQIVGRTGNVEKMGKDIAVNSPISTGVVGWALSKLMGPEKWEKLIKGPSEKDLELPENLEKFRKIEGHSKQFFPTSEMFKNTVNKVTGGYTEPKTKREKQFQEFSEDVGATLTGRSLNNPTIRNIGLNNLLIPATANVTKNIVKDLGFGEDKANLAKMAVWLPLSLAANVNASQYAANLMNQGRQGMNQNLTANVPRYQTLINNTSRNMLQGDPRSALAQQQLSGIQNDIANGQTSIRDLMNRYDAINAAKRDRGLFSLNPGDRRAAIANINQVRDAVRNEIEVLGRANPQALQSWQDGVMAFSTIHRSNAISNWVQSIANGPYAKTLIGPAASLFGVGAVAAKQAPLVSGATTLAGAGIYKAGKTIYRMWNDENLARYYWNAISAAEVENIPVFINNYNKLNKGIEKSESTNKKTKTK